MLKLTAEWIRNVIRNRHANYNLTIELAKRITVHANGEIPEKLIYKRRPSEPEEIKEYRKQIYVPITKNPIGKVITSLQKIRRSQDWSIQYDKEKLPSVIAENESLEYYCENNYPGFTSVTNWVFSELLQRYLYDANSFVAVIAKELPVNSSQYIQPVADVFGSEQVIDYVENEYVVLLSADKVKYTSEKGYRTYFDGNIYYILTTTHIIRYRQVNRSGDLDIDLIYEHGFDRLPAFKVGGVFNRRINNDTVYESRIASMVPSLDEASREYSDLQAEIVQHIHSEKYIYTNLECPHCKGLGLGKEKEKCPHCGGVGHIKSVSPYGEYLIKAQSIGEVSIPTPPIGYIQKSTEIAKLQDERVSAHIYKALASINMEFLSNTPLNQSGVAKEVDKDELNNFVNSIAEDLVRIMDRVYFFICEYRYSVVVSDPDVRKTLLPTIYVPEKFDLLSSSYLMTEIQQARTSNVNPVLLKDMEIEYARKKYNADQDVANELESIYDVDPLYGYSQDEKVVMLNNNGVTERDYVLSCNVIQFVRRAIDENKEFFSLDLMHKKEVIMKYVDEIVKANSAKESVQNELMKGLNNGQPEKTTEVH